MQHFGFFEDCGEFRLLWRLWTEPSAQSINLQFSFVHCFIKGIRRNSSWAVHFSVPYFAKLGLLREPISMLLFIVDQFAILVFWDQGVSGGDYFPPLLQEYYMYVQKRFLWVPQHEMITWSANYVMISEQFSFLRSLTLQNYQNRIKLIKSNKNML